MERVGDLIANAMQGYLIDRNTAQQQQITSIEQLQDPTLAQLFDIDGNGKADLIGCNPGWGCAQIIDHHLQTYGLVDTVEHRQGNYSTLIPETIDRFEQGQPILYYTYTPLWVSGVLRPGQEVEWLEVPFSSLPDQPQGTADTGSAAGLDTGFPLNQIQILANRDFLEQNPMIERFCEQVQIPIEDVSAQNLKMRQGENQPEDIHGHAQAWIDNHRAEFDRWLTEARGSES